MPAFYEYRDATTGHRRRLILEPAPAKLSLRGPHLYVTRAATRAYQELTGAQYETARKILTERILMAPEDPDTPGTYLCFDQAPHIRAYTRVDGTLLVVPKIVAL